MSPVMSYIFVKLRWSKPKVNQLLSLGFGIPSPLLLWYCFLKNCSIGTSCCGRTGGASLPFTVVSSGPCSKVDFCNALIPGIHENAFIISGLLLGFYGSAWSAMLNYLPTFLCQAFFLLFWLPPTSSLIQFIFKIAFPKLVPMCIFSNHVLVLVRIINAIFRNRRYTVGYSLVCGRSCILQLIDGRGLRWHVGEVCGQSVSQPSTRYEITNKRILWWKECQPSQLRAGKCCENQPTRVDVSIEDKSCIMDQENERAWDWR